MPRPASKFLTDAELRIMRILWRRGAATIADLGEDLKPPSARATIQTMLRIMERKRYVKHRVDGRSFVYRAVLGKDCGRRTRHQAIDGAPAYAGALVMRAFQREGLKKTRSSGFVVSSTRASGDRPDRRPRLHRGRRAHDDRGRRRFVVRRAPRGARHQHPWGQPGAAALLERRNALPARRVRHRVGRTRIRAREDPAAHIAPRHAEASRRSAQLH